MSTYDTSKLTRGSGQQSCGWRENWRLVRAAAAKKPEQPDDVHQQAFSGRWRRRKTEEFGSQNSERESKRMRIYDRSCRCHLGRRLKIKITFISFPLPLFAVLPLVESNAAVCSVYSSETHREWCAATIPFGGAFPFHFLFAVPAAPDSEQKIGRRATHT